MADNKNTAPKATTAPTAPKPQTPPTPPSAPVTPAAPASPTPAATAEAKKKREKKPLYFTSAEEAMKEAGARTEGARRPFKVTMHGTDYFLVVHNWEQAVTNVAKDHDGVTFQELGKTVKAPSEATGASIAAMLDKLSETDRKQIEEALAKLKK